MRLFERIPALLDRLSALSTALICLGIALMTVLNGLNITWRGLFGTDIGPVVPWTVVIFVWTVFVGFFPLTHRGHDVVLEYFRQRVSPPVLFALDVLTDLVLLAVCAALLSQALRTLGQQVGPIPMVGIERFWLSVPLFLSAALIFIDTAYRLACRFRPAKKAND